MNRNIPFHTIGMKKPVKGVFSEVNTGDPFLYVKQHINGKDEIKYHVNLIDLLDKVFMYDGIKFLSPEQEKFIKMFFVQAGEVIDKVNSQQSNPFENIDDEYLALDKFLSNYTGQNIGPYTR